MEPVTNGRGFIPFLQILELGNTTLNKASIGIDKKGLYIEGRHIKTTNILETGVIFTLEHYTSRQMATHIAQLRSFDPGEDDFTYFIEANLGITDINLLKQTLGAKDASAGLRFITSSIPFNRIWVKTEKKFPYLKIAILDGLSYKEIYRIEYFKVNDEKSLRI